MITFNRRSAWLFVRRNQIIIDSVLIHKAKKMKAFSFVLVFWAVFASYIGKDLLEINIYIFSVTVRWRRSFHCERSQSVVIASKIAKNHSSLI